MDMVQLLLTIRHKSTKTYHRLAFSGLAIKDVTEIDTRLCARRLSAVIRAQLPACI